MIPFSRKATNTSPSSLPSDILCMISKKITDIPDYVSFRGVCTSWRSSAKPKNSPKQLPWLLLPYQPTSPTRSFFSLSSNKTYHFNCPEVLNKAVCGSSFGWLALITVESALSLWNPITRAEIVLPPPTGFPSYLGPSVPRVVAQYKVHDIDEHCYPLSLDYIHDGYPCNVSLSASPGDVVNGCTVMVTLASSSKFAHCKLGDPVWTITDTGLSGHVTSVALIGDRFYAVDSDGDAVVLDIHDGRRSHISMPYSNYFPELGVYVTNVEDELFMIRTYLWYDESEEEEQCVDVLKLTDMSGQYSWTKVRTLGDLAFFLSGNHASAVRAREFPGGRADSVYFSKVYSSDSEGSKMGGHCIEVFNMKEVGFEPTLRRWRGRMEGLRSSTWIMPTLY